MEKALQDFLLDIECLDVLDSRVGKFNIFDVLNISRTEIRKSNKITWLLNPNENHGMGDAYLRGIIQRLVENDSEGRYDVFKLLLMDLDDFTVYREYKNIDILLLSTKEKTLIAIENKVGSHEHSNQLNRYRDILEKDYESYNKVYIFLTPDGEEPSDVKNWDVFTYYDIVDVLENIIDKMELQPDIKFMIQNYTEAVRRDILEDQSLIDICNKIYNKHKKALDLIFEYRTDGKLQISDAIKSALMELSDEGLIIYFPEWNYFFQTKELNAALPHLDKPISSWETTYIASYWFDVRDGKFAAIFELAGWNVPKTSMNTMQKMIDVLKPKDKRREDFRYKRLYRSQWYDLNNSEDLATDIPNLVRDAIANLSSMHTNLLKEISELD